MVDEASMSAGDMPGLPGGALDLVVATWRPEEVWLHGSRAKGTHRPESDWDLLVVVPDDTAPHLLDLLEAWQLTSALRPPVEVYPVRRSEFDEGRRWVGSLAHIAVNEGRRILAGDALVAAYSVADCAQR